MKNILVLIVLMYCIDSFSQDYYNFFKKSMVFTDITEEIVTKDSNNQDSLITTLFIDEDGVVVSNLVRTIDGKAVMYIYKTYGHENVYESKSGLECVKWRGDTLVYFSLYNGEIGFREWEKKLDGSIYELEYDNMGYGTIKECYPSGKLFKLGFVKNNILNIEEYYESGNLLRKYSIANFLSSYAYIGTYKQYNETGQLLILGNYLNYSDWYKVYNSSDNYLEKGIRNGKWTYYTNKGRVYKEEIYNKGELEIIKEKKIWLKKNNPKLQRD